MSNQEIKPCPECGSFVPCPKCPKCKGSGASPCSRRLSYVKVTAPKGAEGTINLMWDDYPIAWVNSKQIAREMMKEIPEANSRDQSAGTD